jgi:autotransporter-associated beta strand protein
VGGPIKQSGSGQSIVLAGGGTLQLASPNTYTGSTTISANGGTLQIVGPSGSIASTSISVGVGGTLQLAGTTGGLPNSPNITTHGTGTANDGALELTGIATETVGTVSGDTSQISDQNNVQVTVYSGNTTVGDGTNAASLTATQILQNTLTINAGSTVTIAPSGSGIQMDAAATAATSSVATSESTADSDSSSDPFTAIQAAIDSGAISSAKGQQLENRIAAIERLAATDPGLDVSLLEDRVLAALPTPSVWSSSGTSPLIDSGSGLLAVDSGTSGSSPSGATAAFAPAADFGGSPAAVPEPSTLLLAAMGGIGILMAFRRRTFHCE